MFASAVNYLIFSNSATGAAATIGVGGSDSSINIGLVTKDGDIYLSDSTATKAPVFRFYNAATTYFIGLQAGTLSDDTTFTLPTADGTANYPVTTNGSGQLQFGAIAAGAMAALGGSGMSHIGSFTYDLSTTSGTQAITGVGFTPSLVLFLMNVSNTTIVSIGFDNGSAPVCIYNEAGAVATEWANTTSKSIVSLNTGSINVTGYITSFGSDGFTLTWTKNGAATGTATILYLAFK